MKTLDTLEQFCVRHKSCGTKLLLLGDFNAHIKEDKLSQDWNNRGKRLQTFLSKMNLVAVNLSPWCENPQFTYLSNTGNSIVDYIFVGNDVIEYVDLVQVLKEHPDNIAFHLPVTISINLHSDVTEEETSNDNMNYLFEKISWKSCTTEHLHSYNQKLVNSATDLLSKDFSDINNFYEELSNLIKSAAMVLPRVQYKKHIKPYWNNCLKDAKRSVMTARAKWKREGSPRASENVYYRQYKKAKTAYRKAQRRAVWEYERKEFDDIANSIELDHETFWKLIKTKVRRKKKKQKVVALEVDNAVLTNPQVVADLWANYYEKLATPPEHEDQEEMKSKVDEILKNSEDMYDYTFNSSITAEEITSVINTLPKGKSPGIDGITYEHIKYGGEIIVELLLKLFSYIIELEEIPKSFKMAIKIPIPKGNKTSRTFDDHRGISLLPCINKMLERIVLSRLQKEEKYSHQPLQGGYQREQDALTTCFVIDEVVNHCREEKEKVYVAYMDIKKAFDTMWIDAMLFKLQYNKGIAGKTWRLIKNWYIDMKEFVFIGGKASRTYNLYQGTRQGGVLSPWLFLVFIDDLIEELKNTKAGIFLGSLYFGSPMFADDLTMLSRLKSGLDRMLKTAWEYSQKWRFNFSVTKTVILIFGESQQEHEANIRSRTWKLGSQILSEKGSWSNLGKLWLANRDSKEIVSKATCAGREACFMLMAVGTRYGGLNPTVSSNLWRKIGIPKFLYGSELWQLKMNNYIELEKVQNIMVRIMQGLLPGTSGSAARGLLGLLSVEAEIDKRKLYFLGRLINMGAGAPCRRVFFIRLLRWKWNYSKKLTGFVPDIVKILTKYDLLEVLTTYILTNDFPIKPLWKKTVNKHVREHYDRVWREKISKNNQLYLYSKVHTKNEVSHWWIIARKNPSFMKEINNVIRLICGSYKVRGKRVDHPNTYIDYCDSCNRNYLNPANHALLYCLGSQNERELLWDWVNDNLPLEVAVYLATLSDTDFMLTLLGLQSETLCFDMELWTLYLLQSACYISSCFQTSVISI